MTEPTSTAAGSALLKIYGFKVLAGAAIAAMSFLILWPRTAREGVIRMTFTIAGSAAFGEAAHHFVRNVLPWWPPGTEAAMPIYALAGAPCWVVFGGLFRWLDKRQGADLSEIVKDAKEIGK